VGVKVVHVTTSLDPAGGGIVSALDALNVALEGAGHAVSVICLDEPEAAWLADREGAVRAVGRGRGSYQYHPKLKSVLRNQALMADTLIMNGLWQYPGFATRMAAQQAKRPYFVFPHGMLDPWFKQAYPMKHLKKWLYWPWGEYRVLRDAKAVLFTCEEEQRLARLSFPSLYRAREEVVGLGLPDADRDQTFLRRRFLEAHPHFKSSRIMLYLGRLHPKKGIDLLIKAFGICGAADQGYRLLVAGGVSGSGVAPRYLEELRGLAARECPQGTVEFCGVLEGDAKWQALAAAEVFVLPSHQENFGMAVVEALSVGLPVLISDRVNIWREIGHGRAGLVRSDTLDGTQRLLEGWLRMTEAERAGMRQGARKTFLERFEINRVADRLVDILTDSSSAPGTSENRRVRSIA